MNDSRPGARRSSRVWISAGVIVLILIGGALVAKDRLPTLASFGLGFGSGPIHADRLSPEEAPGAHAALAACSEEPLDAKKDCYTAFLTDRLGTAGVEPTMTALENLALLDDDVERDAHVYAHHVGITAYSLSPHVAETFASCSDAFSSGCYHGVIQAYFTDQGSADSATVNTLCAPYKGGGQSRWLLFQCVHGMGHGLTMHFDHHLPTALDACDRLTASWDREACYGGAFMENVVNATSPHHPASRLASEDESAAQSSGHHAAGDAHGGAHGGAGEAAERPPFKALDESDPLYPCSIMARRYLQQCYLMQTSVMLYLNGGDIADASRSCDRAPLQMRPICHQSLGRSVSSRTKDPGDAIRMCRSGSTDFEASCYVGVVKAFVDWASSAEPGLAFCAEVSGDENKDACYQALGEEINALVASRDTRAELCAESEEPFVASCRRGARLP